MILTRHFVSLMRITGGPQCITGWERLIKLFTTSTARWPLNPITHSRFFIKALALSDEKKYDSAIVNYSRAIALLSPTEYDGSQAQAYLHRGNAFKALGRYDEAIADYTHALATHQLAAKSCWRIAECFALQHNSKDAIVWLKKAITNGFTDFNAWKQDKELSLLWNDKDFIKLMK